MKINVKTLKGIRFEIEVKPEFTVADVKNIIETMLGGTYPAEEQMLIHKGKVLKDETTTMEANNVSEKSVIAVMKNKAAFFGTSTAFSGRNSQAKATHPPSTWSSVTRVRATPPAADQKGFYYLPEGLPNNGSLEFLRHNEKFRCLQPLVRSNPTLLKGILMEMKKQNPALYQMIKDNRDDFTRLLLGKPLQGRAVGKQMAQPKELRYRPDDLVLSQSKKLNQGRDGGNEMEQSDKLKLVVTLTPEEFESIERLEAMGFERSVVLWVFFVCDKKEDLAANYLLDHIHEFQ